VTFRLMVTDGDVRWWRKPKNLNGSPGRSEPGAFKSMMFVSGDYGG
jgi:hypothetical protein